MPLNDYGVLIGAKAGYHRDQPDAFGKYFHGHIDVDTPQGRYETAIDVDSERPGVKAQFKVIHLRPAEWGPILQLPNGFHRLPSNGTGGAVDYLRDSRLRSLFVLPEYVEGPIPPWRIPPWKQRLADAIRVLRGTFSPTSAPPANTIVLPTMRTMSRSVKIIDQTPPWTTGTDTDALNALEAMIVDTARILVFGQLYPAKNGRPPGLHNIHQNQGSVPQYRKLDGIWQDGVTVAVHSDGAASAFMNKFSTQSDNTDDNGQTIP